MEVITTMLDHAAHWGFDLRHWLSAQSFGISLWQYTVAIALVLLSLFARHVATIFLNRLVLPWISRAGAIYTGQIISALSRPLTAAISLFGLYLAIKVLMIPTAGEPRNPSLSVFIDQSFQIAVALFVIWSLTRLVNVLTNFLTERAKANDLPVDMPVIPLLQKSLKVFIVVIGGLLVIQHMGYPITSILGGLGIGGLAVALAAQDMIANVFGSVIVFTDKPFKIGDWVRIGEVEGFVEKIGFRSTRIRTWPKSLVTMPNKTIANSQIENWTAMTARQVSFTLPISYEASSTQVEELVKRIEQVVASHPGVDQSYHVISFRGFGENGLEVFIYYFTISTAWKDHLQVRQEINLEVMNIMNELGLSVALPSRRIYMSSPGDVVKQQQLNNKDINRHL